jgi:hypothetical protein
MIVSINQPAYMPWLGYFDRIDASDMHIVLDHVQFEKNSMVNRNKIRNAQNWSWLTVPVETKGQFGQLDIANIKISDRGRWSRKHWNALQSNYARTPHFSEHAPFLEAFYREQTAESQLSSVIQDLNNYFQAALAVKTEICYSSTMKTRNHKSELVLSLCREIGATTYLSGPFGRNYLDRAAFENANIAVKFHDYSPQVYPQAWPGFEPGMAVIDVLANQNQTDATDIMRQGRRISDSWSECP